MIDFITGGLWILFTLFILLTISKTIVITPQNHFSFITFLGKYQKTLPAGLGFKVPFLTLVDARAYLGLTQQVVPLRLKTKDQVTFTIDLNIQYIISRNPNEAFKAMYNIQSLTKTMISVATDASISVTNGIDLENVYNSKEEIINASFNKLTEFFSGDYGIEIKSVLSNEPRLPDEVERNANSVIAAKREKEAATYKAEAIRVEKVGEAEADGESVKIRMDKLGEARENYAQLSSQAVKQLVDAGATASEALNFLSHIGDNDAVVTASRNPASTILLSQSSNVSGGNNSNQQGVPELLGLMQAMNKKLENKQIETTETR